MALVTFPSSSVSIVCISDTHNDDCTQHIPEGDILVHAGDMTDSGTVEELQIAFDWISRLPHKVKIIVAGQFTIGQLLLRKSGSPCIPLPDEYSQSCPGNHDLGLDSSHPDFSEKSLSLFASEQAKRHGIHYLDRTTKTVAYYQDSAGKSVPVRVYGNPCQPDFLKSSYAFTYLPYPDYHSTEAWTTAPTEGDDVDIWVMHSPPKGRLDVVPVPPLTGCAVQAERIANSKPKICIFGHYHSSYGVERVTWCDSSDVVGDVEVLSESILGFPYDELRKGKQTLYVNAAWMTMQKGKTEKRNYPRIIKMVLG